MGEVLTHDFVQHFTVGFSNARKFLWFLLSVLDLDGPELYARLAIDPRRTEFNEITELP